MSAPTPPAAPAQVQSAPTRSARRRLLRNLRAAVPELREPSTSVYVAMATILPEGGAVASQRPRPTGCARGSGEL